MARNTAAEKSSTHTDTEPVKQTEEQKKSRLAALVDKIKEGLLKRPKKPKTPIEITSKD